MIKAAIFDADGTLIDTMGMWKQLDIDFLGMHGIIPEEGYTDIVNKMTLEEGVRYTKEHFSLPISEEEILQTILEMARAFYENKAALKPYVREFLELLSENGVPMAVATSSQRDFILPALKHNQIAHYFQDVYSCADIGINKSNPDIFLLTAKALGVKPEETWVFEDSYHAVQTAKAAGFQVGAVYDASNERKLNETKQAADLYYPLFDGFSSFFSDSFFSRL